MKIPSSLLCGAVALTLAASQSTSAKAAGPGAQDALPTNSTAASEQSDQSSSVETLQTVVVSGLRQSMESALKIKQSAINIVDSIEAEDIGKFPDQNVADSLQRVTGVQITRDKGEGYTIAIRGLSQVENTLNGQEVLTSGGTRALDYEDIPAELVKGVDVYKTSSANQIEGGLGGLVDIHTYQPFDFDGFKLSVNGRGHWGSKRGKLSPEASALISDRWNTNIGEVGAMIDVSFQRKLGDEELPSFSGPTPNTIVTPGQTIFQPANYGGPLLSQFQRDRSGLVGAFQWRPNSRLQFTLNSFISNLSTLDDRAGLNVAMPVADSVPGSFTTFPGTSDMETGQFANDPIFTFGTARDITEEDQNHTLTAEWNATENLQVTGGVNYLESHYWLDYRELDLNATAPIAAFNLGSLMPSAVIQGMNMLDLSNFTVGHLTWSQNKYYSDELAPELAVHWIKQLGPISELDVGVRYAKDTNSFSPIRYYTIPSPALSATSYASLFQPVTVDLLASEDPGVLNTTQWYASYPDELRHGFDQVRSLLGLGTSAIQPSQAGIYDLTERTTAGYLMAKIDTNVGVPLDGNIGVRVVRTSSSMIGTQTDPNNSSLLLPISKHPSYNSTLPSVNLAFHLSYSLIGRIAASKTVTRPDFSQLTPGLTLVPANQTGTSGNPDLQPLYATNCDADLEYYWGGGNAVYGAVFYKKVENFISNQAVRVPINGTDYFITEPVNGPSGKIKGGEMGYTQFFGFLPGFLSGLGVQANVTYVDSSAPTPVAGYNTSLPQLSRYSYNLIGMYEKGPWSGRVAYNWRSKYYSALFLGLGTVGLQPEYYQAFGWLSASIAYKVNDRFTLSVEGDNLTDTVQRIYFSTPTRPFALYGEDREVLFGVRYTM